MGYKGKVVVVKKEKEKEEEEVSLQSGIVTLSCYMQ